MSSWFWKRPSDSTSATTSEDISTKKARDEPQEIATTGKVRFTTQDQRFLKALRIAVDEEAA